MVLQREAVQIESKRYSPDEAFAYCADITNAHYENFPVASLFLPQEKRPLIQAIYAFSRIADDYADESQEPPGERLRKLDEWENQLQACYEGTSEHPVFIALGETVRRAEIPVELLNNLLAAFKRDVVQNRYETFEELLSYCVCSANPVGRLVLSIFGYRDETLFKLSDHICTGLQLANFWQDLAVDAQKDRLYLPLEDLKQFHYSVEEWKNGATGKNFIELMKCEIERTRTMFYDGAELPSLVNKDLQLELKLVWFGGMAILKAIEKNNYDVYNHRPILSPFGKAMVLMRGLLRSDLSRFGKRKMPWDLT